MIFAELVVRVTETDVTPGREERPHSTVLVQEEQVIPYIRRVTVSARVGGMKVAPNPMSDISCRVENTYTAIT